MIANITCNNAHRLGTLKNNKLLSYMENHIFYCKRNPGLRLRIHEKPLYSLKGKYKTLESIVNSEEDIRTKLYLTYENQLDIFDQIRERFIDVFPQIEDIKVEPLKTLDNKMFFLS